MAGEDMKKLLWDVWQVYVGWGRWIAREFQPYKVYMTWANLLTVFITLAVALVGCYFLLKKRRQRKKSLLYSEDEYIRHLEERLTGHNPDEKKKKKREKKIHKTINEPLRTLSYDEKGGAYINLEKDKKSDGEDESGTEEDENIEEIPRHDLIDPFDMAAHIPGELKKIQNKITTREMEKQLTEDQKKEEAQARRDQLEQIFKLMQSQQDKFGTQNTEDLEEQMRMYSL